MSFLHFALSGWLFGVTLFSLSSTAHAEQANRSQDLIRKASAAFGDCIAKKHAPVARAIVTSENAQISSQFVGAVFDNNCQFSIRRDVYWYTDTIIFSIAGGIVRRDYPVPEHFDFSNVPALNRPNVVSPPHAAFSAKDARSKALVDTYNRETAFASMVSFGDCVSRHNPDRVHALLMTAVASDAEGAAIGEMNSSLSACWTGKQIAFNREGLRGILAYAFYRLAGPPKDAKVARQRGGS